MSIRCPVCGSENFFLVVERQWSFKINSIGLEDVVPGELYDEFPGKSLVCDDCGLNCWLEQYNHIVRKIIPMTKEDPDNIEDNN